MFFSDYSGPTFAVTLFFWKKLPCGVAFARESFAACFFVSSVLTASFEPPVFHIYF